MNSESGRTGSQCCTSEPRASLGPSFRDAAADVLRLPLAGEDAVAHRGGVRARLTGICPERLEYVSRYLPHTG